MRIHSEEEQRWVLREVLGEREEELEHLLTALGSGAPPHAGALLLQASDAPETASHCEGVSQGPPSILRINPSLKEGIVMSKDLIPVSSQRD